MANPPNLKRRLRLAVVLAAGAALAGCAGLTPRYPAQANGPQPPVGQGSYKVGKPYQVGGVWYVPREQPDYDMTGVASWYGEEFHQKSTANGERFDMNAISAAHTTLPLPSLVEVTNLENGHKLTVRVNDRGPFVGDRIIDLSKEAARRLGYDRAGLAKVRVRYVGPAPLVTKAEGLRYAEARPAPRPPAASTALDPAIEMAAGAAPQPSPAPAAISAQPLPPITGAAISDAPIGGPPATTPPAIAAAGSTLRIQAGAFASEANAQRAVAQLALAGDASIEPLQRDGQTLYRVMLPAPGDEAAAYALRDHVAQIGFADARVVRTF